LKTETGNQNPEEECNWSPEILQYKTTVRKEFKINIIIMCKLAYTNQSLDIEGTFKRLFRVKCIFILSFYLSLI